MENLVLVLWIILWPLSCVIGRYFDTKIRILFNEKKPLESVIVVSQMIEVVIWVFVANLIHS